MTLVALLGLVVVLLAAAGGGMALLRCLRAETDSLAEQFVLGSAAGLGMLAYAVLAVGLVGWLRAPVLAALVAAAGIAGARSLWRWAVQVINCSGVRVIRRSGVPEEMPPNSERLIAAALLLYCLFIAGITLVGALAPPNGDDWDSLAYHLAAPKIYLARGRIAFIPYDSHTNFPFTLEMLYTLGLTYGGTAGAKLFHWAMGGLTALGIAAFSRRLFPRDGSGVRMPAWGPALAAALFLGIPQVQWQATTAYIDLGTTLYQFLALVAFVYATSGGIRPETRRHGEVSEDQSLGWWVVCGLMSGWAMGTKMTALLPFGLLVMVGVVGAFRPFPPSPHRRWLGMALLSLVGVMVACPWYVKSYLWTHNPVYPFFYSLFPRSVNWTSEAEAAYRHEQQFFGLGHGPRDLLLAPWNLAMQGWAYFNVPSRHAPPGSLPYFDGLQRGGQSAVFLALVPLALFTRRWDRRLNGLLAYAFALLLPWFVLSQQSRYLLPVTAPLAVVAAAVVANLEMDLTQWAAGAFVAMLLLLHASWGWDHVLTRALPVVSGQVSPEAYLRRAFAPYEAMQFINHLPPGSKVALYQETRGFYLDRDYLWANPLQHTLIPYDRFTRGAELVQFLKRQLGVTHVLVNTAGLEGTEGSVWYRLLKAAIDHGDVVPVFEARGVIVYEIP